MKNLQKGFIIPVLLAIIAVLVIGGGVYIYESKKTETTPPVINTQNQLPSQNQQQTNTQTPPITTQQNASNPSPTEATPKLPSIISVTPSSVSIGGTLKIKGTNLDPLGGYPGIGWLTHSHIFVNIKNSNGQTAILWEGGSQGGSAPVSNQITAVLTSTLCTISEVAAGGCPNDRYMAITPGQYSLSIVVDGRGTSKSVPLTITASPAPTPVVSSISSSGMNGQFYPGNQVTISGFYFPGDGKTSPIVWIGSAKVTDVSGLVSATDKQIIFTAPQLAPGTYNLYVTGVVGKQTADPASPGYVVQSNTTQVVVLANTVINLISPSSANVGNTIQISGKGFTASAPGSSSNLVHVYIQTPKITGPESAGLLWVGSPVSDTNITFTLPSFFCTLGGDPGVPCTRQTSLVTGDYLVRVSPPSGIDSTSVNFTIK